MMPAMRGAAAPMAKSWGEDSAPAVVRSIAVAPRASVTVRVAVKVPAAV